MPSALRGRAARLDTQRSMQATRGSTVHASRESMLATSGSTNLVHRKLKERGSQASIFCYVGIPAGRRLLFSAAWVTSTITFSSIFVFCHSLEIAIGTKHCNLSLSQHVYRHDSTVLTVRLPMLGRDAHIEHSYTMAMCQQSLENRAFL